MISPGYACKPSLLLKSIGLSALFYCAGIKTAICFGTEPCRVVLGSMCHCLVPLSWIRNTAASTSTPLFALVGDDGVQ